MLLYIIIVVISSYKFFVESKFHFLILRDLVINLFVVKMSIQFSLHLHI